MTTHEYKIIAEALTEDIAAWLKDWLGQDKDHVGFQVKADIYNVIMNRFKEGIEI